MKITQAESEFKPITIVIETWLEAVDLYNGLTVGSSNHAYVLGKYLREMIYGEDQD